MRTAVKVLLKNHIKKPLENSYWWLYGSSTLSNPRLPVDPRSVLFICKGNICRSVFAQGLAIKIAGEMDIPYMIFDSAGLEVTKAMPPPLEALMVAREFGVILDDHRSKSIIREMAESFDIVIAMEARHMKTLKHLFPQRRNRFFLLSLFDKDDIETKNYFSLYNIEDPFGKDLVQFRICYQRIEKCLMGLFSQLSSGTEN